VAAAVLGHPLYFDPVLWTVLRAVAGFGCAGLFVATESWLNAKAGTAVRGKVFAVYMIATSAAFGGSQFLLNLAPPADFTLFALASILICLALALVSTTRAEQPVPMKQAGLKAGELLAAAPVAVVGCFIGGLISGSFYALMPAFARANGRSVEEISLFMALAIFGGLLMQMPAGKLADSFDRRIVAGALALAFAGIALVVMPVRLTGWFPLFWLLLGGFMSVIYPVCVAHANDRMPTERAVSVSGRLILISGVGSAAGPLLGSAVISAFGARGYFEFLATLAAAFAVFAFVRAASVRGPARKRRRAFVLLQTIFSHNLAHASEEPQPIAPSHAPGHAGARRQGMI
jgi:MFS family permease